MTISKKLREEIEAVTPSWGIIESRLPKLAEPVEEVVDVPVPALIFDHRWGRFHGLTVRDRVAALMREHRILSQREMFHRVWGIIGSEKLKTNSVRRQVKVALLQLEEQSLVRRTQAPKGVEVVRFDEVWWEAM